jgi:hypothetical protein
LLDVGVSVVLGLGLQAVNLTDHDHAGCIDLRWQRLEEIPAPNRIDSDF